MVDEKEYSDYADDYSHLSGFFENIFSGAKSIVSNIFSAVKPAAPALIYQAATGKELPPTQVTVQAQERPATPITTYLMYGGAALVGGLLLMKMFSKKR